MTAAAPSLEDYADLLRDDLGLDLGDSADSAEKALRADLDQLPDWDSLMLLKLVTALEKATGSRIAVGDVMQARSLVAIYEIATRT